LSRPSDLSGQHDRVDHGPVGAPAVRGRIATVRALTMRSCYGGSGHWLPAIQRTSGGRSHSERLPLAAAVPRAASGPGRRRARSGVHRLAVRTHAWRGRRPGPHALCHQQLAERDGSREPRRVRTHPRSYPGAVLHRLRANPPGHQGRPPRRAAAAADHRPGRCLVPPGHRCRRRHLAR